jgi:hypothetical protein
MRPLYLKGYVNGKPLTKMFVDGGAAVNVMPYTTFRKLGMGPGDLTPTSIILNDFAGNTPCLGSGLRILFNCSRTTVIATWKLRGFP